MEIVFFTTDTCMRHSLFENSLDFDLAQTPSIIQ